MKQSEVDHLKSKAAVADDHNRHREKAEAILNLSPASYLAWGWVEAIVAEAARLRAEIDDILAFLEEEGHRDLASDIRRSVLKKWGK